MAWWSNLCNRKRYQWSPRRTNSCPRLRNGTFPGIVRSIMVTTISQYPWRVCPLSFVEMVLMMVVGGWRKRCSLVCYLSSLREQDRNMSLISWVCRISFLNRDLIRSVWLLFLQGGETRINGLDPMVCAAACSASFACAETLNGKHQYVNIVLMISTSSSSPILEIQGLQAIIRTYLLSFFFLFSLEYNTEYVELVWERKTTIYSHITRTFKSLHSNSFNQCFNSTSIYQVY